MLDTQKVMMIDRCITRYYCLTGSTVKRTTAFLDLEYSKVNVLKLCRLSDVDFVHDMNGIFRHMDRENKTLADGFVPRAGIEVR